jgi:fructoselysine and glucoselysine-specific PTS system IID component
MEEQIVKTPESGGIKLTKKDLRSTFWRSLFDMSSINYERFQSLGFLFAMTPLIKKLYPTKEGRSAAMKRHLAMFNTNPTMIPPILGTVAALEEQNASGADTADAINDIKVGLMGPFAGIGDSLFWGTLRPIFAGIGAALALQGNYFGPVLFLILWNVVYFPFRYLTVFYGYTVGVGMLLEAKKSNILQKISSGASVLGLMVLGVLVADWITISTPIVFNAGKTIIKLQEVLDGIVPSLLPLLTFMVLIALLRKKINPNKLIVGIFIAALLLSLVKFLGA